MGDITTIEDVSVTSPAAEPVVAQIDPAALVATHAALLFRVAHSILRSPTEAEDVVQDVFLRVLQHRLNLASVRDMRVWLIRIAWNLALDRRRHIRPDQMDEAFAHSLVARTPPTDQLLDEAQRLHAVLRVLDRLPKAERHILLLAAIEELDTKEIGAITGKTESAVRALLFRARTRLRQRLERGGHA